jgi:hypothetical protein
MIREVFAAILLLFFYAYPCLGAIPEGYVFQELGYDDGKVNAGNSLGSKGHGVFFKNDGEFIIEEIRIFGGRYDDICKEITVEIWDNEFRTKYSRTYSYDDYFPESYSPLELDNYEWVTIDIDDISISTDFYVAIFTQSGAPIWNKEWNSEGIKYGGIYIGMDHDTRSGNTYKINRDPNGIADWANLHGDLQSECDWMIRAVGSGDRLLPAAKMPSEEYDTMPAMQKPVEKSAPGFGFILGLLSISALLVFRRTTS